MKIYVAGHSGLVGSAVVRKIEADGIHTWVGKSRAQLDLRVGEAVKEYIAGEKPDAVIMAAARVGGIVANVNDPVGFLAENLKIQTSLLEAAHHSRVPNLVFLGSSCIYPKDAPQPMKEEYLLTGPLEPTNQSYALAKLAGIQMVNSYRQQFGYKWISLLPTNLYGPNDNFDLETSHVIPGMISKFLTAKERQAQTVVLWGTGNPRRDFLHVDDLGSAILHLLEKYDGDVPINIGTGKDISIRELAEVIKEAVGFSGEVVFDASKPDGAARKLLEVSQAKNYGWHSTIDLRRGLQDTIRHFESNPVEGDGISS